VLDPLSSVFWVIDIKSLCNGKDKSVVSVTSRCDDDFFLPVTE
jgi:hypothetical protein